MVKVAIFISFIGKTFFAFVPKHGEKNYWEQQDFMGRHLGTQDGLSTIEQTSLRPKAVHEALLKASRQFLLLHTDS
jgi:hypothetical protein